MEGCRLASFGPGLVDDSAAGLQYFHPAGWTRQTEELPTPVTSLLRSTSDHSVVASGCWDRSPIDPPSTDELQAGAAWLASEYGELYLDGPGTRVSIKMERTTAAGQPAAIAGYNHVFDALNRAPAYVRVLVIAVTPGQLSFVLAVAPATTRHLIDDILASVAPLPTH
jgi:hypothetical protein